MIELYALLVFMIIGALVAVEMEDLAFLGRLGQRRRPGHFDDVSGLEGP